MPSIFRRKKSASTNKEPGSDTQTPPPSSDTPMQNIDSFLKQEYKQWEKTHAKMKDSPPPNGHDYLKHATNLLALLEGLGAADTLLTKAVIECFKAAVLFEQDRRENDARVTSVFLAQTDMMRVLLDVDELANRRRNRSNVDVLRSDATLNEVLLSVQQEIKSCGNSIDTYYNESRFVKFWKAQDWKERILGHIDQFNKFRVELQQTLSIQVASGVEDLVSKMDMVLSRFFTPKHDWEKALDTKTQQLQGNTSDLSLNTLQSLISVTQDPSSISSNAAQAPMAFAAEVQLFKVKKELELSLDMLCDKNVNKFEMKLSFHAQQMEQAIANSAQLVIRSLSGPSDRLVNDDLKQLWKEMAWIFCVENKFFVSALFEFYLDRFSTNISITAPPPKEGEATAASEKGTIDWFKQLFSLSVSAPKFSFLSRLGSINHPDAWTLEYIALHGEQITRTIDSDDSGFIRISEANAFAQQCPKGWNLPQWCAYSAAGWAYEARIYRRRIANLTFKLTEMQASVLQSNRAYLFLFSIVNFCTICHAFTREPPIEKPHIYTPELRELVKEKVLEQDSLYREHLQSLKWTVEDESTIHLLYGDRDPEKYILQFCTLMLEQLLAVTGECRTITVDVREWLRLSAAFRVMREITVKRVSELGARFEHSKYAGEDITTYHGGIWSYVVHELDVNKIDTLNSDMFVPYSRQELAEFLADRPILDDFPPTMTLPYLEYPAWEEFVKTVDPADMPSPIPKTWDTIDDKLFSHLTDRTFRADFPGEWGCDRCRCMQEGLRRYSCIKCPGLDFCNDCLTLDSNEYVAQHSPLHPYVLLSFVFMPEEQQRIVLEAENVLEQLQQQYRAQQRSIATPDALPLEDKGDIPNEEKEGSQEENSSAKGKKETLLVEEQAPSGEVPSEIQTLKEDKAASLEAELSQEEDTRAEKIQTPTIDEGEYSGQKDEHENRDNLLNRTVDEKEVTSSDDEEKTMAGKASRPTPVNIPFICGRCVGPISWESIFYRCVGHGCQNYYVCQKCLPDRFEADEDEHQWWHSLFCLRKDLIVDTHSALPSPEAVEIVENTNSSSTDEVEKGDKLEAFDPTIYAKISNIEEKLLVLDHIHASNSALDLKVEKLEAKLDAMIATLNGLIVNLTLSS